MLVLTRKPIKGQNVIWIGSFIRITTLITTLPNDTRARIGLQIPEGIPLYSGKQGEIELPPYLGLLTRPLTMEQTRKLPMRTYRMRVRGKLYIGANFEVELMLIEKKPTGDVRLGITAHTDMPILRGELLAE